MFNANIKLFVFSYLIIRHLLCKEESYRADELYLSLTEWTYSELKTNQI